MDDRVKNLYTISAYIIYSFSFYFYLSALVYVRLILTYACFFLFFLKRVFLEADMMAKKYREKLPPAFISQRPDGLHNNVLPFENEALYANWKWFKFER